MLKSWRRSGLVSRASWTSLLALSLGLMEVRYGTDIAHIKKSENLTLRLCLHYITRPFCTSEFVCRILQESLAQLFNSHWYDCLPVKIIFFSALTRFFNSVFLNSDIHCWRIVPYTRKKMHEPINVLNYWNNKKNFIVNYGSST